MNRRILIFCTALTLTASGFCGCGASETIEVRPDADFTVPESQIEYFSAEVCTSSVPQETKKLSVSSETGRNGETAVPDSVPVTETFMVQNEETQKPSEKSEESKKEDNPSPVQEHSPSPSPLPDVPQNPSPSPSPSVPPSVPSETSVALKYADGVLIVNKSYPVPSDYVPENLVLVPGSSEEYLLPEVCDAFREMSSAAWNEGLTLWVQSGYRSYQLQTRLYNNYVSQSGKEAADTFSARPGHSEHHTGLAFDLNTITDSCADTEEGKWVAANCYKYGFIIRYPKDKESITGYKYEPWHLRYLGKELAEKVYNSGLCLEEYYGLTSEYSN